MLGKILGVIGAAIAMVALIVGLSALFAWPVQLLYNYLAPGTLWDITFRQAWALSLLCSLLFKSNK